MKKHLPASGFTLIELMNITFITFITANPAAVVIRHIFAASKPLEPYPSSVISASRQAPSLLPMPPSTAAGPATPDITDGGHLAI